MNQVMRIKSQQLVAYKAGNIWPIRYGREEATFHFITGARMKYVKLVCEFCFDGETWFGSISDLCPVCRGTGYLAKTYRWRPRQNRRLKKRISYLCPEGCGTDREVSYWGGCGCCARGRVYVDLK